MSIITISKGSYYHGQDVARRLAKELGYDCVSREILLDASDQFNIPEIRLVGAIKDPPSIFGRLSVEKQKYVNYIRAAFLKYMRKDNLVYHGFAGHFFLKEIPAVFKVRVIASMEYRIMTVMKRENVSSQEASNTIKKIDSARRKWSLHFYGMDTADPDLYDAVYRIDRMNVEDVVNNIMSTVQLPCFQISSESKKIIEDLYLEAQVGASLAEQFPTTRYISSKDGKVTVLVEATVKQKQKMSPRIEAIISSIDGVKDFEIRFRH